MRLNIGREYAQQHNPHRIRKHCAAVKQALELYCWLGEKENGIERHTLKHSPLISNVIVNQMLLNFVILHNKPNDLCVLCVWCVVCGGDDDDGSGGIISSNGIFTMRK